MFFVPTKLFWEKMTFYVDYVKNNKNRYLNKSFHDIFLIFFAQPTKKSIFLETVRKHILPPF
jgi:hypothetical protein